MTNKTRKTWVRTVIGAVAGGLALALSLAGVASADDTIDDALQHEWDGTTLSLDWTGANRYAVSTVNFHGQPVSVPGDQIHRVLNVTNKGPCPANLTVSAINIATNNASDTVNLEFEQITRLLWDVNGTRGQEQFAVLSAAGRQALATVPVGKDETVPVTIGYEFPYDETGGRHLGKTSQELVFDVELKLQGDYCTGEPSSEPSPSASPSPSPSRPAGSLPFTGAQVAGVAGVAAALIGFGFLLWLVARRRRREETV